MIKKLISFAMSLVMALSLGTNVFASDKVNNDALIVASLFQDILETSSENQFIIDELSGDITIGDFEITGEEIEQIREELPSFNLSTMSPEERDNFMLLIEDQVEIVAAEELANGNANFDRDAFRKELTSLFEVNPYSRSIHVPVSNRAVGAAMDLVISAVLLTAGVGTIAALIKAQGAAAAKKLFFVSIGDRIMAWGGTYFAGTLTIVAEYVVNFLAPGDWIAEKIDAHDQIPNNGYFDLYLF